MREVMTAQADDDIRCKIHTRMIERRNSFHNTTQSLSHLTENLQLLKSSNTTNLCHTADSMDNYLSEQNRKFNQLITRNLDFVKLNQSESQIEIDAFLDSIDDPTKQKLYHSLEQEMTFDQESINNMTLLEKIEMILVLLVKLNFLLIRYLIPLSQKFYHKFMNNQLMIFNNNNLNRLLGMIIKFINHIERGDQEEESSLGLWNVLRVAEEFARQCR